VGRVVASNPGEVVISLGAADGLEPGMRVKLSVQSQEPFGAGESVVSTERVAVGTVTGVSEHHAKVELGLNESAPVGALAERTRAPATTALTTPPRVTGVWEAQLMGRPFVAIEELGGGIVASASIGRRFDGNLHLRALLDPFAFADAKRQEGSTSEKPSLVTASGVFIASYDSQFLEMGAGIGAQTVSELGEPGSGLAVAQVMRLGALDGLHLDVRSTIVLFRSEFAFGSLAITARIPVSRRYWVVLGGGGGVTGHGYGELGLRVLLGGNGGRGSTFLTATAGGAGVFKSSYCTEVNFSFDCTEHVMYAGPMVGVGMEWRF
jgi:hypothetical protein